MSDISKINTMKPSVTPSDKVKAADEKLHEVAELYERHFIREMMKQMRATVHEGGFIQQNNAEKIFKDQLDDQYAEQWSKSGGIGLSGMIYEQLVNKFGVQMGIKTPLERPHGPLPINEKADFAGIVAKSPAASGAGQLGPKSSSAVTYKFQTAPGEPTELKNPWVGILLDKKFMDMDQIQYRIKHDNGLESLILTRGSGLGSEHKLSPGDTIQSGQQIGWAGAASPLFWTLKSNVSE